MIKNKDFQNNIHGGLVDLFGLMNGYLNNLKIFLERLKKQK